MGEARYAMVTLDDVESIKGLDFQHVLLVMGEANYREASAGFQGVGRRVYENRKLLRIPFTRARDSMTVLVLKDYLPWDPKVAAAKKKAASPRWGRPYPKPTPPAAKPKAD